MPLRNESEGSKISSSRAYQNFEYIPPYGEAGSFEKKKPRSLNYFFDAGKISPLWQDENREQKRFLRAKRSFFAAQRQIFFGSKEKKKEKYPPFPGTRRTKFVLPFGSLKRALNGVLQLKRRQSPHPEVR